MPISMSAWRIPSKYFSRCEIFFSTYILIASVSSIPVPWMLMIIQKNYLRKYLYFFFESNPKLIIHLGLYLINEHEDIVCSRATKVHNKIYMSFRNLRIADSFPFHSHLFHQPPSRNFSF